MGRRNFGGFLALGGRRCFDVDVDVDVDFAEDGDGMWRGGGSNLGRWDGGCCAVTDARFSCEILVGRCWLLLLLWWR